VPDKPDDTKQYCQQYDSRQQAFAGTRSFCHRALI
jgi:hypothetical protein